MSLRKVSCLKCIFLRGNFEDDRKVYRCQANDLKKINISNPILCSKYRGKRKKIIKKDFKLENIKDNLENYFDTEQLYKNMLEKQENK
ncbi:MAG: hypothetical protein ACETVY_00055 [Candidatus Bathyarchaeia archaeon]